MSCLFSSTLPLIEPFDLTMEMTICYWVAQINTGVCSILYLMKTICGWHHSCLIHNKQVLVLQLTVVWLGYSFRLLYPPLDIVQKKKQKQKNKNKKRIGRLQVNIVLQSTNSLWHTKVIQPIGLYEELALYWYTFSNSCVIYCSFNIEYICKGYHNICESHPCSE